MLQRAPWATPPPVRTERTGRVLSLTVLFAVTAAASYGQILFGYDNYSPESWLWPARIAVAVGMAVVAEAIGLFVNWQAHDSYMRGRTGPAARQRRAAYLVALYVAGVNYSHFSDGWQPSSAAVVFALFSASGPWLWGLHTRRAHDIQLTQDGKADTAPAVFGSARWWAFPLRTLGARRWSIDHSVSDPRTAWDGYNVERVTRKVAGASGDSPAVGSESTVETPPAPTPPVATDDTTTEPPPLAPLLLKEPVSASAKKPAGVTERVPPGHVPAEAVALIEGGMGHTKLQRELGIGPATARRYIATVNPPKPRSKAGAR